jgi:hypothetical protein
MHIERHRAKRLFTGSRFEVERSVLRGLACRSGYLDGSGCGEGLNAGDAHQHDRRRQYELPNSLRGRCHFR